jgi:hypothetical protein
MQPHSIGMFGIKLVGAITPEFAFFGRDGEPSLMNFPNSPEGRRVATTTPIGHKSLVYLMHPIKRFWTAIEYVTWDPSAANVLDDGMGAARAQGAVGLMEAVNSTYAKLWRCVRVVAMINDPMQAPTPDFQFREGEVLREISLQEYQDLFDAIPWSWTA